MSLAREKHTKVPFKTVARVLGPYFGKHKIAFSVSALLILISTAIDIFKPIVTGKAVDVAMGADKNAALLNQLCLIFISMVSVRFFVDTAKGYIVQTCGQKITHRLRTDLFERILHFPVSYFDVNPVGRPLTRVINDIKTLGEVFTASIAVIALDAVLIVGTVGAMLWLHWKLAAVVLFTFPLVIWMIHFFGSRLAEAYRKARARLAEINAFLGENIGAVATIQRLGAEATRFDKFRRITESHFDAQMKSLDVYAKMQPLINLVNGVATSSLLLLGGYWVIQGEISLGVLVAFLGYIRNLFVPLRDLVEKYNQLLSAQVAAERIVGLITEPTEMAVLDERELFIPPENYGVSFEKVTFTYPTRDTPALKDVSFTIPHGRSLAVVGATGSGKSSLVRLLLRFYEPQSGVISLNQCPLPDWDKSHLRRSIGVVHQDIYLVRGTLRENLTLVDSEHTDAFLIEQCKNAQLWDIIRHRGGLDAIVYEGGTNFSIGEKQLIALARILIFNPPVLILDEATASIDRILERKLMSAVEQTMAGRTSIVIAHRLSTIESCDQIMLMEEGKIMEKGTSAELLSRPSLFSQFHRVSDNL